MTGTILIADGVTTNRIVLKVKLAAAFYSVVQASSGAEALRAIQQHKPDLVIIGDTLPDQTAAELCTRLKMGKTPELLPIVLVASVQSQEARLDALRAGADDVLTKPLDDQVMLARLRSLLRARDMDQELRLRDGTERALGFAEETAPFESPAKIALICQDPRFCRSLKHELERSLPHSVEAMRTSVALSRAETNWDTLVIRLCPKGPSQELALLSDLRTRRGTRHAGIIVIVPQDCRAAAASALDLGASDILPEPYHPDELSLRINAQTSRKRVSDRLRDRLRDGMRAAVTDSLTGLYNRRYAMPHLQRALEHAARSGHSCAVMVADIDHFKTVNDRFGHAAGDTVLVSVAERLRDNLRSVDLIARTGGEEFLIVMPETDRDAACAAADRMCRLIGAEQVPLPGRTDRVQVTISIGLTLSDCLNPPDAGASEGAEAQALKLLDRADQALYRAKQNGRNRVTFARAAAA